MNANDTPIKSPRRWLVLIWIVVLGLFFPAVAALWAGALAEALIGDMEPMFIVNATFIIAAAVGLISGAALMTMTFVLPFRFLRVVLIVISIFELVSIPLCQGVVALGRHRRARRLAPITSVHSPRNETNTKANPQVSLGCEAHQR
jgi:hypothetical protein